MVWFLLFLAKRSLAGNFLISSGDLSSDINQLSISESRDLWPSYETNEQSKVETARQRLERIAETVRFSIGFSDFPKVIFCIFSVYNFWSSFHQNYLFILTVCTGSTRCL